VRDVNHAMSAQLKQPQLGRMLPAANSKPRAQTKSGRSTRVHRYIGHIVGSRQQLQYGER